jgi:hypothetical protein
MALGQREMRFHHSALLATPSRNWPGPATAIDGLQS